VALEPDRDFRAAGLVEAFARRGVRGARLLLPASSRAREELAGGLRALGAGVDVVTAYDVVEPLGLSAAVARCLNEGFDLALFASPSAVESFAREAGRRAEGLRAVVIGPTTGAAARGAGMAVVGTARPSTAEGLVEAAEAAAAAGSARRPDGP
jgi:uroporphyrinogen-III synthase